MATSPGDVAAGAIVPYRTHLAQQTTVKTGLAVRPFPQTEEVTAGRAASGGLPTRQVVAEDGPRPSRQLVADATPRSHFVGWGCWQSSAGIGAPIPPATKPARRHCRAGWLVLATGAPAAAHWRPGGPSAPTSRRTRRLDPHQVSGSQPPGSR